MSFAFNEILEELLKAQRREASVRHDGLGPLPAAVGLIRAYTSCTRELLDLLDTEVAFHLEILNQLLVKTYGNEWWLKLSKLDGQEA